MTQYRFATAIVSAVILTMAASPASAQSPEPAVVKLSAPIAVKVTPFVSIGSTVSSQIGAAVRFGWTPTLSLESETGYRRNRGFSTHLSLLYDLPRSERLRPYAAGGIGVEEYQRASEGPWPGFAIQQRIAFVLNAGAGLEVPVASRWAFRTDIRWFSGIRTFAPEHWRVFNGITIGRRTR